MMDQNSLLPLLATRLCHDLASPIGALANTADLMREFGPPEMSDDIAMLNRTAEHASRLLQFLRLVFGGSSEHDPGVEIGRFRELARSQEVANRVTLKVISVEDEIPSSVAQAAGMLLMIGRTALGLRGEMRLVLPASGNNEIELTVTGKKAAMNDEMRELLAGGDPSKPSVIEFYLLKQMLAATKGEISYQESEGLVLFTLRM